MTFGPFGGSSQRKVDAWEVNACPCTLGYNLAPWVGDIPCCTSWSCNAPLPHDSPAAGDDDGGSTDDSERMKNMDMTLAVDLHSPADVDLDNVPDIDLCCLSFYHCPRVLFSPRLRARSPCPPLSVRTWRLYHWRTQPPPHPPLHSPSAHQMRPHTAWVQRSASPEGAFLHKKAPTPAEKYKTVGIIQNSGRHTRQWA